VADARIESLRRFKDDVREVTTGFECGIGLAGVDDIAEGDIIECYQMTAEQPA
jgi:translation initiation factor IF-2